MTGLDPIGVLEVGYAPYATERDWLHAVAQSIRPLVDEEQLAVHAYVACGPWRRAHDIVLPGSFPREVLARALAEPLAFPPVAEDNWETMVHQLATARGLASMHAVFGPAVGSFWGHGVQDSVAFICADGQGQAVVVAAVARRPMRVEAAAETLWRRVAVHVGAARRLLRADRCLDSESVESVLEPGGRVVDARGVARSHAARERLRDAVRAIDRARTNRGRADPVAALRAWSGLLAGRWSLVDHFDTDGRRFVIARENQPRSPVQGPLTRRQRQVAFYASLGWSNAEIGYSLGVASTTVSMHLSRALQRLGLASRLELVNVATRLAVEAFASSSASMEDAGAALPQTPT